MKSPLLIIFISSCLFLSKGQAQNILINEICASNYICYEDSADDHGDWIELYNAGGSSVNVAGMYLTDDLSVPNKFLIPGTYPSATTIPAGGRRIFWFDEKEYKGVTHIDGKLNGSGEQVGLTASDGVTIIDSVTYGKQLYDISFGRSSDGNSSWSFFPVPTPNAANSGGGYSGIAGKADFSQNAGFHGSSILVELSYPDSTATIYYSLNGNEPSPTKGILYTGPIQVDSMNVIRARVFVPGLIPGEVNTRSYFINRTHDLPVISIATDSLNLWDTNTGIYVLGPPGYSNNFPYMGANFWEKWKRPGHIEMFETNDVEVISQNLNISISGNYSRAYAQKSFNFEAKDALGQSSIPYQIFPDLPIAEFKAFKVRNGGQDWPFTTLRDGMNHKLTEGYMNLDHQDNRPAAIYLNGQYWGILNITEKIDEDYINEHYPEVDKDSIDLLENNATELLGSNDDYNNMISFITSNTMSNQNNYNYVKTKMEVPNFIDFEQLRIYLAATDWPSNNMKFWRPSNGSQRWKWIVWDTERSTMIKWDRETNYDHNTMNWATDHTLFGGGYPTWSTFLLRKLLLNNEFKTDFISRFAGHINFTFCEQRMDSITDAFRNRLTFEMPNHIGKWKDSNDTMIYWTQGYFKNMAEWNLKVDTIKIFFEHRAPYMRTFIMQQFGINDTSELTINKVPADGGIVFIDTFEVPDNHCNLVYFNGYATQLTAVANPGYTFAGWTTAGGDTLPITWMPNGDTTVTAYFNAPAPEPTIASSNGVANVVNCTDVNFSWTNGNGASRIVVMKSTSAVNVFPMDGNEYAANTTFGGGDDLGAGNYVVYSGSGSSCTITGLSSGTHYYLAVVEYNGTTSSTNYNVSAYLTGDVTPQTFNVIVSAASDTICEGTSVVLSAGGGVSYQWSPSTGLSSTTDSVVTATLTATQTYTIDATGVNGCHATNSITIIVNALPVVVLSAFSAVCTDDSLFAMTNGTPAGGIYAGAGVMNGNFDPLIAGTGTHVIAYSFTDNNGCTNADSAFILVNQNPFVYIGNDTTICEYNTILLDAGAGFASYFWSNGATTQTIQADSSGTGTGTGTFSVIVTNASGCDAIDDINVTFDICASLTESELSSVFIFPNPFSNEITVSVSEENASIALYDVLGNIIFMHEMTNTVETFQPEIAPGIYFLSVEQDKGVEVMKVVKTK